MDVVTAKDYVSSTYNKTFNYTYDSDSNLVASIDGGSYDHIRNYDDHRDMLKEVNTKCGSASRAQYIVDTPNSDITWQNQYKEIRLDRYDSNSLAAKFGSGSDITYEMDYEKDHQLKSWDSSRTHGAVAYNTKGRCQQGGHQQRDQGQ